MQLNLTDFTTAASMSETEFVVYGILQNAGQIQVELVLRFSALLPSSH